MAKAFDIKPAIYVVPKIGRVDCTKELPIEMQVQLYLSPHFKVFIELKKDGIKLLKKEGLPDQTLARLIMAAQSAEEIALLLDVKSSKTIKKIAETALKKFVE